MYSGRHGPVLLDLPKNVMSSEVIPSDDKVYIKLRNNKPISKLAPQRFKNGQAIITKKTKPEEIIKAILGAKKPVLLVGQGIFQSDSIKELRYLAELFNIPVVSTIWALGTIPSEHYLSCKFLGMHGVPYANYTVQNSDLLIVLGCRLDDRITGNPELFAPNATIMTVEIEKSNINKTIQSDYYINSDCKEVLTKMIKYYNKNDCQLIELGIKHEYFSANLKWYDQIKEWKKNDFSYVRKYNVLQSRHVISTLNNILKAYKEQITVIADVGMHQMHVAQFINWDADKVRFITSGGAGSMGFALPASIGVKLALPENKVVCICGDGGFTMSIAEIITAVNNKVNIKVFIINNNVQMMVKLWQDKFYNKQFIGIDMNNPSFDEICQSMGCHSIVITNVITKKP
jgi:acetolactate synthase-1/2/3 large subunit